MSMTMNFAGYGILIVILILTVTIILVNTGESSADLVNSTIETRTDVTSITATTITNSGIQRFVTSLDTDQVNCGVRASPIPNNFFGEEDNEHYLRLSNDNGALLRVFENTGLNLGSYKYSGKQWCIINDFGPSGMSSGIPYPMIGSSNSVFLVEDPTKILFEDVKEYNIAGSLTQNPLLYVEKTKICFIAKNADNLDKVRSCNAPVTTLTNEESFKNIYDTLTTCKERLDEQPICDCPITYTLHEDVRLEFVTGTNNLQLNLASKAENVIVDSERFDDTSFTYNSVENPRRTMIWQNSWYEKNGFIATSNGKELGVNQLVIRLIKNEFQLLSNDALSAPQC